VRRRAAGHYRVGEPAPLAVPYSFRVRRHPNASESTDRPRGQRTTEVPNMPQPRRRFFGLSRTDILRLAGSVLGGLFAGWLVSEVAQLIPGIRQTSVMGSTSAQSPFRPGQSPFPTSAVPQSDGADTRPAAAVPVSQGSSEVPRRRVPPVTRVATPGRTTTESSIEPNVRTTETSATRLPHSL
jgi:hypothetical protein